MITQSELRTVLVNKINDAGGVCAFAKQAGVSHALVSRTASGELEIGPSIANALGYVAVTFFVPVRGEA